MCGIVGFWSTAPIGEPTSVIATRMTDAIAYRGPDDAGVWTDEAHGVALGHRRLAIIDTSPAGHQPMVSGCGRYVLTFNGEIYNHSELRDSLQRDGAAQHWRGHSDTETLLAAIGAWGLDDALKQAVGMFAIALWDRQTKTLRLARDRLGEKPVYYAWIKGSFVFASELKALWPFPGFDRAVNRDVLGLFMQFGNVPSPYSIFEHVHKLGPASVLTLTQESLVRRAPQISTFWSLYAAAAHSLEYQFQSETEALETLDADLRTAVASQSIADVPLGAFLSGGIDSSLIAALMQAQSKAKVKTYTVGFEEQEFDESPFAKAVAAHLGTDHHELRLSADDARAVIPHIPVIYDEPFADSSQIATHLVCKAARTQVKVALSGDGGDELFGGYNRYFWSRRVWNVWSRLPHPIRAAAVRGIASLPAATLDGFGRALGNQWGVAHLGTKAHKVARRLQAIDKLEDMHRLLLTEWPADSELVLGARSLPPFPLSVIGSPPKAELEQSMMMFDTLTYLPDDVLTKVDRAAMSVSLETRVPFLDHRVVETAWRLPLSMKIRGGKGKWALRQILYKYVPRELLERPKTGFAIPLGDWLRGPLRPWAESLLDIERLKAGGRRGPAA